MLIYKIFANSSMYNQIVYTVWC